MKFGSTLMAELEPARLQFIEQTFREILGSTAFSSGPPRTDLLRWTHDRLFVDHAPLDTVRLELHQRIRKTRLVAVTSGKGGVGKTTLSVNLAVALAQQGQRVLLFDADLGLGNVHVFAGVNPTTTLLDVLDGRVRVGGAIHKGPGGIDVICGASGIGRLADVTLPMLEKLSRDLMEAAAAYDVLLIDTGAGVSASVMHFLRMVQDAIVVTTPNLAATLDAYGVIKLARENQLGAHLHLLVNQADDEVQAARAQDRITGCADRFLQSAPSELGFLFRDPVVEAASQRRVPLVLAYPDHINSRRIADIARTLLEREENSVQPGATAAA